MKPRSYRQGTRRTQTTLSQRTLVALLLLYALCAAQPAPGIVFHATGDPAYNTNAPSGALVESGWQVTGHLGNYLGTAISTNAVLSAWHLRSQGAINNGTAFTYEGQSFSLLSYTNDPASDLMVWRVQGSFTNYARLYVDDDEVGRHMVIHGRGRDRGAVVVTGTLTNGWKFGSNNYTRRWGENDVAGVDDYASLGDGVLLRASFDADAVPNECMLSTGDSGGGVFLRKGSDWRLAGVNFSLHPAYFKQTTNEVRFLATMMDCRGLYVDVYGNNTLWAYVPTNGPPAPASLYASRVSRRLAWLQSVVPEIVLPPITPRTTVISVR